MNLSDLRQMVEPYVARGDTFADDLHRLLTIIESDFGLAKPAAAKAPDNQETDPTARAQAQAVDQARQQFQTGQGGQADQGGQATGGQSAGQGETATVEPETVTGPVVGDQADQHGQGETAPGQGA